MTTPPWWREVMVYYYNKTNILGDQYQAMILNHTDLVHAYITQFLILTVHAVRVEWLRRDQTSFL